MQILAENKPSGKFKTWHLTNETLLSVIYKAQFTVLNWGTLSLTSRQYSQYKTQKWLIWCDHSWQCKCNILSISYVTGLYPLGCSHGNLMKSFYSQWLLHMLGFFCLFFYFKNDRPYFSLFPNYLTMSPFSHQYFTRM